MKGQCEIISYKLIDQILSETPDGYVAMFRVISVPPWTDDYFLGESVYIKKDKVYSFTGGKQIKDLTSDNLRFVTYIKDMK
jgi:hypothetical protein